MGGNYWSNFHFSLKDSVVIQIQSFSVQNAPSNDHTSYHDTVWRLILASCFRYYYHFGAISQTVCGKIMFIICDYIFHDIAKHCRYDYIKNLKVYWCWYIYSYVVHCCTHNPPSSECLLIFLYSSVANKQCCGL